MVTVIDAIPESLPVSIGCPECGAVTEMQVSVYLLLRGFRTIYPICPECHATLKTNLCLSVAAYSFREYA